MKAVIGKTKALAGPLLALMLTLLPGVVRPAAAQVSTIDLGTLSGTTVNPYDTSSAVAINDRGTVIGNSNVYDANHNLTGYHGFLWANGRMTDLGALGADSSGSSYSYAVAINASGTVLGNSTAFDSNHNPLGSHAFVYANGRMTDLGSLGTDVDGTSYSDPLAINDSGQVIGTSQVFDADHNSKGYHAYLYANGRMTDLGSVGGTDAYGNSYSYPVAINAAGQVVGWCEIYDADHNDRGSRAFLYANGQMTDLGALGMDPNRNSYSYPVAINAAGQVVGTSAIYSADYSEVSTHAFLYSNGSMVDLGGFGTDANGVSYSNAQGINGSGQVVGTSAVFDADHNPKGYHAFLYANGQMTDLGALSTDANGSSNSYALAINDAGQVIGASDIFTGRRNVSSHAFLYANGQMTDLDKVDGTGAFRDTAAVAINARGQVIGTANIYDSNQNYLGGHAFLYDNGRMIDLGSPGGTDPDGFSYSEPVAINATGHVVGGFAVYDAGHNYVGAHAFLTNRAPAAAADAATTNFCTPVTVAVLNNDVDGDGDTLTVTGVTQPAVGSVVRNADNTLTYTPKRGSTGSVRFTYTIQDGYGGTATATVTIAVTLPGPGSHPGPK